jgi:hypothetical protein
MFPSTAVSPNARPMQARVMTDGRNQYVERR